VTLRWLLPAILVLAIVWQAFRPERRLVGVVFAASASCLASAVLGGPSAREVFAAVPWDVLIILVALAALSGIFAEARVFQRVAVAIARISRGDPRRLYVVVAVTMYLVSALVNNLTALLLVLPVVLVILRLIAPTQRYTSWTLGVMLVACNLGGAATPIGDFPAILLLGAGRMRFDAYLAQASPATAVALALLLITVRFAIRPAAALPRDELTRRITLRVAEGMHRGVRVDPRLALPAAATLLAMLLAWTLLPPSWGVTPDLVAWVGGAVALALVGAVGERVARRSVDGESVLFLLALFLMVGTVRATGLFETAGQLLLSLPGPPAVRLVVFLVLAAVLTGLFSAGPSMAALLEVADVLARELPPDAVYVGLALSVCAGSSLFLTAATSGPLAQALAERAELRDAHGNRLVFGFREFVPAGLVSFTTILAVGVAQALLRI
jgi:Na+/H+ antiporter NhaD/arsenite permease-like protein